jgi:CRP-like cAMP-binding protein
VSDFAHADLARSQIIRNVWYAFRRQATEFPLPAGAMALPAAKNRKDLGELIQDLRKVDLFSDLPEEDLRIIIPSVKVGQYGRGEVIIRQGAVGDSFFVLRRGTVEVLVNGAGRHAPIVVNHIDHLMEPNYFGEIALLKGEPRNATVRAGTDVEVLEVNREGFAHLFKARPESAPAIAKIAALREEQNVARTSAVEVSSAAVQEEQNSMLATMRKIFDF